MGKKAEPSPGEVYAVDVGGDWIVLQFVEAVWMAHVARVLGRFDVLPDLDDCRERPSVSSPRST